MSRIFASVLIASLVMALSSETVYAQQKSDQEYDKFLEEARAAFKKQKAWYRIWSRYDINPGFSSFSLGYANTFPMLGWSKFEKRFGVRYRMKHVEAGYARWTGFSEQADSVATGVRVSLGYSTPSGIFRIGKRQMDVRGFLIQPMAALGYTYTTGNHGAYVAPGIHLQLPFTVFSARLNTEYTFGEGGGFNLFPEFTVQLDGLATLLDPELTRTGTYRSEGGYVQPLGNGWYRVVHNEYNSPFYIKDIGPLLAVTPRVGYAVAPQLPKPYTTSGIGLSGRISFFGADIHVDKSKMVTGVVPNVQALDGTVKKEFDNSKVLGTTNTTEVTFEGSFNVVGLLLTIFKKNAISKMGNATTPMNRLHFNLGYTWMVPGKTTLLDPDEAQQYTDQFFADRPDIERNAINDPLQKEKEWGVTYGLSLELGAVGVRVNNKLSKTLGRGSTVEVYYMLPVGKLYKAYKKK